MILEVNNFGKIKKGRIDLDKKVTVFVGYNNSGKTYMSQLLWGIISSDILDRFRGGEFIDLDYISDSEILITDDNILKLVKGYYAYVKNTLLPDLFNVAEDYFLLEEFSIKFLTNFLKKVEEASLIYYELNIQDGKEGYRFSKAENSLCVSFEKVKFNPDSEAYAGKYNFLRPYKFSTPQEEIVKESISKMIFLSLFDFAFEYFFLPANRAFYPSFYKYIYSVAKDVNDSIGNRLRRGGDWESIKMLSKVPYSKPTNALIDGIFRLNYGNHASEFHVDLLQELKEIIGGDIIVKSAEGIAPIEFFLKLDDGKELDMYMASSSANQLTTLYLYFKFWAEEKNNYLIIDEPEENLHPDNQIKLINILMKFADRGNKILITTHSPLITDHVNNYANLGYLNEAGSDTDKLIADGKMNIANVKNIKHADYGVYFFGGDGIKEYAFDDYGAYFMDFADAEEKVKDMSKALRENIYAQKHANG